MGIKVFNKVLLDSREFDSLKDMRRKNFCGAYFALQVEWALREKGIFEDEFYTIKEVR